MELKNLHSFESGAPSSQEQWMQCVEGVCDCSEEEIIEYPSITTISPVLDMIIICSWV